MSGEVGSGVEAIYFGLAAYIIATASPGPATLAIMATSARHGRKAGVQLASGVVCGSLFWGLCAAFGLATIMAQFAGLFVVIKILGGLYLLWLAYKSFRSALSTAAPPTAAPTTARGRYMLQGLAIHLTNPKAVLAWVAILSIGVQQGAPAWHSLLMFGGCAVLGVIVFIGYALVFSTSRAQMVYQKARRLFEVTFGLVFGAAGLALISGRG